MADEFAAPGLDISLRDYIDLVRRRRAVIIQALIAVVAGGFALTLTQKPSYRSSTRILLEGKSFSVAQYDANNPVSGLFMQDNGHDIATQLEVIQGEQVMSDAYKDAGIPAGSAQISVAPVQGTDLVDIAVDSTVPGRAEALARALPRTYLRFVNGNRRSEVATALAFAQARLNDENQRLLNAQLKLRQVRKLSHVYEVADDRKAKYAAAAQAVSEYEKAKISFAGTDARLAGLIPQRRGMPAFIETPTTTTNPDITGLNKSIADLLTQRASLSVLFKPTSAKIETIDAQIGDLKARLAATPSVLTSVTRTRNEAIPDIDKQIAASRVELASRNATLGALQARAANSTKAMLDFDLNETNQEQLESEVASAKANVALFTKTEEDLNLRNKATHDPVMVVTQAGRAMRTGPRQMQTIVFACMAGLLVGICLALVQEYMDDSVNSPEDLREILPVPTLGFVPLIEQEESLILSEKSQGSVLECYRVLRSNVRFATVDKPMSSILISSAVPGEGKSITAVNLAIALARDGVRVILVDLDLRRPTIHKKLDLRQSPGVTNVLIGHTSLEDALQETDVPGLRILTAGPLAPNPAELLNSKAMQTLQQELKGSADVVVVDGPPFLATADSQLLSAMVDGTIFVAHLGAVKKQAVRHVRTLLDQSHGVLLGVVFNKIDLSEKRDDYYYGYYRYYSYYQTDGTAKKRITSTKEFDNLLAEVQSKDGAVAVVPTSEPSHDVEKEASS